MRVCRPCFDFISLAAADKTLRPNLVYLFISFFLNPFAGLPYPTEKKYCLQMALFSFFPPQRGF